MISAVPKWKIELRASTYPVVEWVPLTLVNGRLAKYIDKGDAEAALKMLKRVQPHLFVRIAPM